MTTVPGGGSGAPEPPLLAIEGIGAAIAYATNWMTVLHGYTGYVPLGHLWSLSVEEQLYVVWAPVLVVALGRSARHAGVVALLAAAASLADVAILTVYDPSIRVYMGTDTRAGAFLLGGACAIARARGCFARLPHGRAADAIAAVGVAGLAAAMWPLSHSADYLSTVGAWVGATVAAAVLVLAATGGTGWCARALSVRWLRFVGQRSYALYLWHYVWLTWLRALGTTGTLLALVASFCCAEASWRLVEEPSLRRGRRTVTTTVLEDLSEPIAA